MKRLVAFSVFAAFAFFATSAFAKDPVRVATWKVELGGDGPGILLRDILRGSDTQITEALAHIETHSPDILLLTGFDTDSDGRTARAFAEAAEYEFSYTRLSNAGVSSGFDLDQDGRLGEPEDALSYGRYRGHGGMALLSKFEISAQAVQDFSDVLWSDVPETLFPRSFYNEDIAQNLPLSSHGHWSIPIQLGASQINILAFAATSPVFDGDEDRNGRRNHDQIAFWSRYLTEQEAHAAPVIVLGNANLDPVDGEGRHDAIGALLAHPALQDPKPQSDRAKQMANLDQQGDPALDTANWNEPTPGNLRVDYVLPDRSFEILDAGVSWSESDDFSFRHGLVWVDLAPLP